MAILLLLADLDLDIHYEVLLERRNRLLLGQPRELLNKSGKSDEAADAHLDHDLILLPHIIAELHLLVVRARKVHLDRSLDAERDRLRGRGLRYKGARERRLYPHVELST